MSATFRPTPQPRTPNPEPRPSACDLCGATDARFVLSTPRLDGPLMRCANCGLYYVTPPAPRNASLPRHAQSESERAAADMERLDKRARELKLVEPAVEEGEGRWRELTARERFADLLRVGGGSNGDRAARRRLLEIGCATGDFLSAARSAFDVCGVEANPASAAVARSRGVECVGGSLADAGFHDAHFDAVALYHVIEHLPSPARALAEIHRVLRPGGLLAVETPNIANVWFRLLGARWRQFIPDHIFFFAPQTIRQALEQSGFAVREVRVVGKAMSARLFISRLGRYSPALSRSLTPLSDGLGLSDRTLRLNLGDVMRVYAEKRKSGVGSGESEENGEAAFYSDF